MRYAIIFSLAVLLLMSSVSAEEPNGLNGENGVPYIIAFLAGVISVMSPCAVPLLFGYLAVISKKKEKFWTKSLSFFAGLALVWVLLGFSASGLGNLISGNQTLFHQVTGGLILIFGIMYLFDISLPSFQMRKGVDMSTFGMFTFGMLFTIVWVPCVGPILGSILMVAANGSAIEGVLLLFVYAIGFMLSLIAVFLLLQKGSKKVRFNWGITIGKRKLAVYNLVAGVFLIFLGLVYMFDKIGYLLNALSPLLGVGYAIEGIILDNPVVAGVITLAIIGSGFFLRWRHAK